MTSQKKKIIWTVLAVLGSIILLGACGALLYGGIELVKRSGAYVLATDFVSGHELVQREIGTVEGFGFMPQGTVEGTGSTGKADLSIDVKGQRGDGTLYTRLTKESDLWRIVEAEFEVSSSGERFNLLVPGDEAAKELVARTLARLDQAVETRDFASLHAELGEPWRSQVSPGELENVLLPFTEGDVQMSEFTGIAPVFDVAPAVGPDGTLFLSALYPTTPSGARFNLRYTYEHSGWKLVGVHIDVQ